MRTENEKDIDGKKGLPPRVKESNSIGIEAGDATSGVDISPEEWAEEEPIRDAPTYALEPGDPSPLQPAAGSPQRERKGAPQRPEEREEKPDRR